MKKGKLLVLTPRLPYPVIGGDRLRIYEVCKALSNTYNLTLLSLCESKSEELLELPSDGVFTAVERIYLSKWRSYLNCFLALVSDTPLQVAYYSSAKFRKSYHRLVKSHDATICHLIRTAEYAKNSDAPCVVEFTDAISLNYDRVKKLTNKKGLKSRIYSLEQSRLNKYEKEIGDLSQLNVFVSEYDVNYLFTHGSDARKKTIVCSNGVDTESLRFVERKRSKEIVFIGNMLSAQNMDAALWFANNVMPHLIDDGYIFRVVGRISSYNRHKLNQLKGVSASGSVDNINNAVSDSFIGVCPMRIGAGVQNKVLEYMALGLPCITSSMGYEGLYAKQGVDLFIEDQVQNIIERIKQLYVDLNLYRNVAESARQYVETSHSWSAKLSPLITSIDRLLE